MARMRKSVSLSWSVLAFIAILTSSADAFSNLPSLQRSTFAPIKVRYLDGHLISRPDGAAPDFPRKQAHRQSTSLHFGRNDNLFSGLAEIGIGFSIGVLWSEYYIIRTGCGPLNFSDTSERICYQGVIVLMAIALFNRIVARQSLDKTAEEFFGPLLDSTLIQIRLAETATVIAVVGAIVALGVQTQSGANMDGLSGIDVSFCRALRDS